MYRSLVRRRVRRGFQLLSSGRLDELVRAFAPGAVLAFPGEHRLAGESRGPLEIRAWFEEMRGVLPEFRLIPREIVVEGPPWRTRVATHFDVVATLADGSAYRNEGMQLLEIRWGRIHQDRLFEDTQIVAAALERVDAAAGAGAPPAVRHGQ
jgi:ketosteroid isomerase-like protein